MADAADPLDTSGGVPYQTLAHLRQVCPVSRTASQRVERPDPRDEGRALGRLRWRAVVTRPA